MSIRGDTGHAVAIDFIEIAEEFRGLVATQSMVAGEEFASPIRRTAKLDLAAALPESEGTLTNAKAAPSREK